MSVCFSLFPIGSSTPARLVEVDDAMREAFGAPPDAHDYYRNWYDTIGLGLALGHSFERLKTEFFPNSADIIEWLAARYSPEAWVER